MASNLFTRGQICGVNNCRSKLWRVINGQHICQYGHIRENDYEFEDEPDEQSGHKRVITLPKHLTQSQMQSIHEIQSQRSMATLQVFGSAGKRLLFKIVQIILQKQTEFLVNEIRISKDLYKIVKHLWTLYLDMIFRENIVYDPIHSLVICYLGSRYINAEIYINDILELAAVNKLPFMRPAKVISLKLLSKLPSYFRKHIEPSYLPSNSKFYTETISLSRKLGKHKFMKLNISSILIDQLDFVCKIVKILCLPKQIIDAVYNLVNYHNIDVSFSDIMNCRKKNTKTVAIINFAEIKLVCLIISSAKFYFSLHEGLCAEWQQIYFNDKYSFSKNEVSEKDFDKCIRFMSTNSKYKNDLDLLMLAFPEDLDNQSDFSSKYINKNKPLSKSLEKYFEWFDENVISYAKNTESMTISDKKLMLIFNGETENTGNSEDSRLYKRLNSEEKSNMRLTSCNEPDTYDEIYENFNRHKKESLENVIKMERILISKLSADFGVHRNQLKYQVTHFSDKLLILLL